MKPYRVVTAIISALYCSVGVCVAAIGLVSSVAYLAASRSTEVVVFFAAIALLGMLLVTAGISLYRQKPWSRWLFLALAVLSSSGFYWFVSRPPKATWAELYSYLMNPLPGQTTEAVAWQLSQAYVPPLFVVLASWATAGYALWRFRMSPNPSIERTSSGKPAAASHVER